MKLSNNITDDIYKPVAVNKEQTFKLGNKLVLTFIFSTSLQLAESLNVNSFQLECVEQKKDNTSSVEKMMDNVIDFLKVNASYLESVVDNLSTAADWGSYDMKSPSDAVIKNTKKFIDYCNDDRLLFGVEVFLRKNGTILLKWNDSTRLASVNLGTESFSYAIIPKNGDKEKTGDYMYQEEDSIIKFYNDL